jgi:hypothetical protein
MTGAGSVRMTRSYILLHCPNERLRIARVEAWEGKDPGGVRVLLANPRWERWFVKFLELSGAGRTMADGTDEDGARATRMDEFGKRGRGPPLRVNLSLCFPCYSYLFVRRARTPRLALPRMEDLLCRILPAEGRKLVSFVLPRPHIPYG